MKYINYKVTDSKGGDALEVSVEEGGDDGILVELEVGLKHLDEEQHNELIDYLIKAREYLYGGEKSLSTRKKQVRASNELSDGDEVFLALDDARGKVVGDPKGGEVIVE